ncbi:MAG: hypothetical protein OQK72_12680 [Gammaproteobacteria bacterium]|nr:hypothetical protein [Gammaproteobacteria bacterium]MCW9005335.1 hypothetical protein [Gammaproteobacteria bacterium]MCW9056313.1 hypothetical protein [Gammaproteobacteria bacterium]
MSKPTDNELKIALKKAIEMKEHDNDEHFIAKTLINHHYRVRYLEDVLKIADRYMNHGMADHEHTQLLRAIEKAKEAEERTSGNEHEDFGLE